MPAEFPFSVITGETVARRISEDVPGCMEAVRQGYLAHSAGNSVTPPSLFLRFADRPEARIIALPTHLASPWKMSGIKWIASFPENVRHGFPRASAVIILNNHENGYPVACLEGSIISASRTAALAVLAAQQFYPDDRRIKSLGIVGTGLIGRYLYRFLSASGFTMDTVHLHDLAPEMAERFAARVCEHHRHSAVIVDKDPATLIRACDLIVFATTAARPYVHDRSLLDHNPAILHISLRDLAPELLLDAWNVVDDIDHVMHADTSPHLTEKLTGSRNFVTGTLAGLMQGQYVIDRGRPIIFSPFGLGALDLALSKWIYDRSVSCGDQLEINSFFHDLER
jgi:2,3-diaminopropionate biosynthesis protein SbnB